MVIQRLLAVDEYHKALIVIYRFPNVSRLKQRLVYEKNYLILYLKLMSYYPEVTALGTIVMVVQYVILWIILLNTKHSHREQTFVLHVRYLLGSSSPVEPYPAETYYRTAASVNSIRAEKIEAHLLWNELTIDGV